jgi:hypothetical protein
LLAKDVNDDACCLDEHAALGFFASRLAPTIGSGNIRKDHVTPNPKQQNAPRNRGVLSEVRSHYFSARSFRAFKVLNGASTTNLLATIDGMLPPGSVCT